MSKLWLDNFGKPGKYQRLIGERRKRKLLLDCARKTTEKYRRQRIMNRLRLPISRPDNNYGSHPSEPDISDDELKQLCHEHIERLRVTQEEAKIISEKTADQSDDVDHMWEAQRRGRITASNFGEACKRKTNMSGLTKRIIYGKNRCTAAMRYGNENENRAERIIYLTFDQHHQMQLSRKQDYTFLINTLGLVLHLMVLLRIHQATILKVCSRSNVLSGLKIPLWLNCVLKNSINHRICF